MPLLLSLLVASLYLVGKMWNRNSAVVLSFFLNQLKTASSLNCPLRIIHLWWRAMKSAMHSSRLFLGLLGFWLFSLLDFWWEEARTAVVSTVCRGRDRVFLLLLSDLISWVDSTSAIICAASFLVRYSCVCGGYNCVERLVRNLSSEY